MPATQGRTPGVDCLSRGLRSLRANPSLAAALWLQQALTLGLTAAGFVPLLAAFGIPWYPPPELPPLRRLLADPELVLAPLADLVLRWPEVAAAFALAVVQASLVWLLATLLFCWFQGGVYGVLDEADRRAAGVNAPWPRFRAASWGAFADAGRRLLWPCFKLIHLYLAAVLLLLLAWSLLLLAASRLAGPGRELTAALVGVVLLLVLVLPLAALALVSFWLAQAELPRPGATVHGAARRSLAVLHRRPADVTLLFAVYLVGSAVVVSAGALAARFLSGAAELALVAVELTALVVLTTAFAAATVALMRDAAPEGAR